MAIHMTARRMFSGSLVFGVVLLCGCAHLPVQTSETDIKLAYRQLIDVENKHDLPAVRATVWDSPSTLFVAKAPVGWHGYWGIDDVMGHLRDMYQGPFRIDPKYEAEKVVFLRPDIAETYVPVDITVAYAAQNPVPKPFIMVLLWIKTHEGWRMATDIPIPIDPPISRAG